MKSLYDWQEEDVQYWVDCAQSGFSKSVLCAWEQSLGKTLAATEYAKRLAVDVVLVIAPINTFRSWSKTFQEQYSDLPVRRLGKSRKDVVNFTNLKARVPGVYVIGWELMRRGSIEGAVVDLAIADETHRQQNRGSNSHFAIKGIEAEYKIALSGTPAGNKPDGIFATLHWLWPKRYKSHQAWVDTFWRVRRNGAIIDFVREQTPGGVIADIPIYSRRLRKDHRDDIPDRLPEQVIEVDITPTQRKLYNAIKMDAGTWIDDQFMGTSIPLVEDLRLRQICLGVPSVSDDGEVSFALDCKSTKMDMLFEVLAGEPDDATMLVLVPSARFIHSAVHQLNKKGIKAEGMSGELTPANSKERDYVLEGFGKRFRVMVASIAAIAEGTDGLQGVSSRQFWLGKHANQMLNSQANVRLHRPGQTEVVKSWYTVAKDTVDEDSIERLEDIQHKLDTMLDYGKDKS